MVLALFEDIILLHFFLQLPVCVFMPVSASLQVAEYLVPNVRSIPSNGSTKPTYIRFLTGLKAYSQIFSVK